MRTIVTCMAVLLWEMALVSEVTAAENKLNLSLTPTPNTGQVTQRADYLLKTCEEFSSGGGGQVDPAGSLAVELGNRNNRDILNDPTTLAAIKTILLEGTQHGKLTAKKRSYNYIVESDYLGIDKAVFMAEFEGKLYKVVINFVITLAIDENSPQCPPSELIKVNNITNQKQGASIELTKR